MQRYRLTKLSDNDSKLRTKTVEGEVLYLPEVGSSFSILSDPLEEGYLYRQVTTSIVTELTEQGFKTRNSEYKLERID